MFLLQVLKILLKTKIMYAKQTMILIALFILVTRFFIIDNLYYTNFFLFKIKDFTK